MDYCSIGYTGKEVCLLEWKELCVDQYISSSQIKWRKYIAKNPLHLLAVDFFALFYIKGVTKEFHTEWGKEVVAGNTENYNVSHWVKDVVEMRIK